MNWLRDMEYCPRCGCRTFDVAGVKNRRCRHCGFELFMNASASTAAVIINGRDELLVVRRAKEPARGTYDLPGGFADAGETAEEGVAREVMEETGLTVVSAEYLFSEPNTYEYGGLLIPTQDLFFRCSVADATAPHAHDDAAECLWIPLNRVRPEDFGLASISRGIERLMKIVAAHDATTRYN